ncbi:MAG: hypothetical protein ABIN56_10195 [Dokdonella sp.]
MPSFIDNLPALLRLGLQQKMRAIQSDMLRSRPEEIPLHGDQTIVIRCNREQRYIYLTQCITFIEIAQQAEARTQYIDRYRTHNSLHSLHASARCSEPGAHCPHQQRRSEDRSQMRAEGCRRDDLQQRVWTNHETRDQHNPSDARIAPLQLQRNRSRERFRDHDAGPSVCDRGIRVRHVVIDLPTCVRGIAHDVYFDIGPAPCEPLEQVTAAIKTR